MARDAPKVLDPKMQAWLTQVQAWMEKEIPFNVHLGFTLVSVVPGCVVAKVPYAPHLIGDPDRPALHGGVTSMLADTAGGAAVITKVEPGSRLSTVDLRVDYLRPGRLEDLYARAEVIRLGNRVGVAQITIYQLAYEQGAAEHHVADGRAVYNVRRA